MFPSVHWTIGELFDETHVMGHNRGGTPRYAVIKKLRDYLGIFPIIGEGGLLNSQNFCKLTKYFFVCQIHSEVLKHVLHRGGGDI